VYQTIDACGEASLIEIQRYLPAAMIRSNIKYDLAKLNRCLNMLQYRGFIQDKDGRYHISPYEYFAVRDEWLTKNTSMNTPPSQRKRRVQRIPERPGPRIKRTAATEHPRRVVSELVILTAAAFTGGLVLGTAFGLALGGL
jgi:hypothetical protein